MASCVALRIVSLTSSKLWPILFSLGNKRKSRAAKSGECRGRGNTGIYLDAENSRTEGAERAAIGIKTRDDFGFHVSGLLRRTFSVELSNNRIIKRSIHRLTRRYEHTTD